MAVLSFLSQKGGAGKSTLARGAAVEFARNGWAIQVADMDTGQQTFSTWVDERNQAGLEPSIEVGLYRDAKTAIRAAKLYDLLVVDGRPFADMQSLELARASDLVVIPTGVTKDDLKPALEFANLLRHDGIPQQRIMLAVVRVPSASEARSSISSIRDWGFYVPDHYMDFKASYGQAMDTGRAMTETNFEGVSKRGDALVQSIADRLMEITSNG